MSQSDKWLVRSGEEEQEASLCIEEWIRKAS